MDDRYGYFAQDGKEYVVTTADTPRPWYNYLWNDHYVAFVSQVGSGEGIAQDSPAHRVDLVINRMLFLVEGGRFWSLHGLPLTEPANQFSCVHGLGYSMITQERSGIRTEWTLHVPEGRRAEVWSVRVTNLRIAPCALALVPYLRTALDDFDRPQGYFVATGGYDADQKALIAKQYADFAGQHEVYGYLASDAPVASYDSRQSAFIGPYGTDQQPDALARGGGCRRSETIGEKLCFALEVAVALESLESRTIHFAAGVELSRDEVGRACRELLATEAPAASLSVVREKFQRQIEGLYVETPDEKLNYLVNYWMKHQTNLGSRWARVRHNGFRDISCDVDCMAVFNPELAWTRFRRVLRRQYASGFAPRTWIHGKIQDRNYNDNTVWLTYAAYDLVMELGCPDLLAEEVPFNDGTQATVYEHLRRSVDHLWNDRGDNGLIRIRGGDWNDCLERVGPAGKGTSVWLSMAWYRACGQLEELATLLGREADAVAAREQRAEMRTAVNDVAWDGEYFTRAYADNGEVLGSSSCKEGRIFINPQIWAVLSGIAEPDRLAQAMASVDRYLDTPLGVRLSTPGYTQRLEHIGHMSEKPAGVHENGGIYLHTVAWKMAADAMLNRGRHVQQALERCLPHGDAEVKKICEPYIFCNSYFGKETGYQYGSAGNSWRTGSGAWLLKALITYVYGLQPELGGLRLRPCLPPAWPTCRVEKSFRGATYVITYHREGAGGGALIRLQIDGQDWPPGDCLPCKPGALHRVEAWVGVSALAEATT